jgi:hypothetical protein
VSDTVISQNINLSSWIAVMASTESVTISGIQNKQFRVILLVWISIE